MSKETRQALNNEMDALENLIPGLSDLSLSTQQSPIVEPLIRSTDFQKMSDDCDVEALKIVTNTALFYLTLEEIQSDKYLMDKLSVDSQEISNLLFQSKAAKNTYIRLLEEIDGGNVHARMFEVQGGLQKSMMEITKSKTAYIQIMENSWRNVRQELQLKNMQSGDGGEEEFTTGSLKSRGTKDFLREIQEELKLEAKELGTEVEIEEETTTETTTVIPLLKDEELSE